MQPSDQTPVIRPIRSFVRRQGRLTAGQLYALENLWHTYVLDPQGKHDFNTLFGRQAELFLEIGFGNGENLLKLAAANPERDYIGIEVHRPGVGQLLGHLHQQGINNVRVFCHDAIDILQQHMPAHSLAGVLLFFPDPWHKTRHHKRRIVNPEFANLIAHKLQTDGYFHAATDWHDYAKHMLRVLAAEPLLHNTSPTGDYCERPTYRTLTKFENRGLRLGHGVWDLVFSRVQETVAQ